MHALSFSRAKFSTVLPQEKACTWEDNRLVLPKLLSLLDFRVDLDSICGNAYPFPQASGPWFSDGAHHS